MQPLSSISGRSAPGHPLSARAAEAWESADDEPTGASAADSPRARPTDLGAERRPGQRVRVLIVEDRELLAEAVGAILRTDPALELVGIETELGRAPERIGRTGAEIVVLDFASLTRAAGLRFSVELRAAHPNTRLIVLTHDEDEATLLSCARAGAAAQVSQRRPSAELLAAIKRVHAGEVLFAPELLVKLLDRPGGANEPTEHQTSRPLAPRERAVLQCLANGLSTDEVAVALGITPHTVRSHLKHAMAKLQVRSKLEAVIRALRLGLIKLP